MTQKKALMKAREIVKEQTIETKAWNLTKGKVALNFTLRVDKPEDMDLFVELLEEAVRSVHEERSKRFD